MSKREMDLIAQTAEQSARAAEHLQGEVQELKINQVEMKSELKSLGGDLQEVKAEVKDLQKEAQDNRSWKDKGRGIALFVSFLLALAGVVAAFTGNLTCTPVNPPIKMERNK